MAGCIQLNLRMICRFSLSNSEWLGDNALLAIFGRFALLLLGIAPRADHLELSFVEVWPIEGRSNQGRQFGVVRTSGGLSYVFFKVRYLLISTRHPEENAVLWFSSAIGL